MKNTSFRALPGVLAVALLFSASPASADAIDGHWCISGGRHMFIEGPQIVTPRGARTTGDYERHAFAYKVPESEPGAGSTVSMMLLDEERVQVRTEKPGATTEIWHRCGPPIT